MNIYDIAEATGLSLRTLRKIDAYGFLIVEKSENPIVDDIMKNLHKGNRLTASQLLHLVKCPKDVKLLDRWKYDVRKYLDILGDPMQEKMPWSIAVSASLANNGDKDSKDKLAHWFCNFIDMNPAFENGASCDYAFLVVRMLADVPEIHLAHLAKIARTVMRNCRRGQRMVGYYHTDPKRHLRFHRCKKDFDL